VLAAAALCITDESHSKLGVPTHGLDGLEQHLPFCKDEEVEATTLDSLSGSQAPLLLPGISDA
jgi:hypothetical protein